MKTKRGLASKIREMAAGNVPRHEIAETLGCSRPNVTQVLHGKDRKRTPPASGTQKLMGGLQRPDDDNLTETDWPAEEARHEPNTATKEA